MNRPSVTVVMPYGGEAPAPSAILDTLRGLRTAAEDELILVDNTASGMAWDPAWLDRVRVVRADAERSPAHARNAGAERAANEWILFLDADCRAPADLLELYFSDPVNDEVGALAGEVIAAPAPDTVAGRYGAARSFLSQEQHLAHPFRARAVAANLLVRRDAFEQVGGFYEGVRAAEDTDFSWRLQEAGWRLELRPEAAVEHHYRASLAELRRQWRGYAAGRAWLARRYDGFVPEPAAHRALGRVWRRLRGAQTMPRGAPTLAPRTARLERGRFLAIDALLSAEELAGLALSNRPARTPRPRSGVVLVADRFPVRRDPLVELALALEGARVEAAARPDAPAVEVIRRLDIDYREDDGIAARLLALAWLVSRHPLRSWVEFLGGERDSPGLAALAPAVRRLERDPQARVLALGGGSTAAVARRLARLAGRRYDEAPQAAPAASEPVHR